LANDNKCFWGKVHKYFTLIARIVAVQFIIRFDGSWESAPRSGFIQLVAWSTASAPSSWELLPPDVTCQQNYKSYSETARHLIMQNSVIAGQPLTNLHNFVYHLLSLWLHA
jgi:hypothetical protein